MKKFILSSLFLSCLFLVPDFSYSSILYKSNSSGNWNSISSWLISINSGSSWSAPVNAPDTYNCDEIRILSTHNVTVTSNTNAGILVIDNGGILTINSGIELEIINKSGIDLNLFNGATIAGSGTISTASSGVTDLNFQGYSVFSVKLNVKSSAGITNIYGSTFPYKPILRNELTVDAGGVIQCNSLQGFETRSPVTNNGTISGSNTMSAKGNIINNSVININNLSIDSNLTISGTGAVSSPSLTIGIIKTLTLGNDMTFNSPNIYCNGTILLFNGSGRNLTLGANCNLYVYSFGNLSNGSIFLNGGNIDIQNGTFSSILNAVSGTTLILNSLTQSTANIGTVNIYPNANLNVQSGDTMKVTGTMTNEGNVGGSGWMHYNAAFMNNYNIISVSNLNFAQGVFTIIQGDTGKITSNVMNIKNNTTLYLSNHSLNNVNVNSGSTLRFDYFFPIYSTVKFLSSDPIVNSGTINQTKGIIEYAGSAGQVISAMTYRSLKINNPGGTQAGNNFNVTDSLKIVSGDLDLNGKEITLNTSAYLSETNGNNVTGYTGSIKTTRTISNPSNYSFGGLGLTVTSSANLGSTLVKRTHSAAVINGYNSVIRNFEITPSNNSGLNATLNFYYDESELNGNSGTNLALYKSTNSGVSYSFQGGNADDGNNKVTKTGIGSFSRWSLSRAVYPASIKIITEGLYISDKLNKRDTAKVYLRNISMPYAIIDSAVSEIDSINFTGIFDFKNAPAGNYFYQIKHKNSIETWSKTGGENYLGGISNSYDFTNSVNKAYGNNLVKVNNSPQRFAVYSGDIDQDGAIDVSDGSITENDAYAFISGNVITDLNGDGIVDIGDVVFVDNNASNFIIVLKP